jgi:hypothetical protein
MVPRSSGNIANTSFCAKSLIALAKSFLDGCARANVENEVINTNRQIILLIVFMVLMF